MQAVGELVFHHGGRVLALEVGNPIEDDDLLFTTDLVHLKHDNMIRIGDQLAQGWRGINVAPQFHRCSEEAKEQTKQAFHGTSPFGGFGGTTSSSPNRLWPNHLYDDDRTFADCWRFAER